MVIKEDNKSIKNLYNSAGFMLLEAVALVGLVIFIGSAAATLHGLIMKSYRATENRMAALSYAENVLASALTGVAYQPQNRETQKASMQPAALQQKNIFKSDVTKTAGVPFLPYQKPFSIVTVTVTWHDHAMHDKDQEKKVMLTRVIVET